MPILLAAPPPPPSNTMATCSTSVADAHIPSTISHQTTYSPTRDNPSICSGSSERPKAKSPEPASEGSVCVSLDCPSIGDVMAARLSMCVLGHMLYLKSQIPFPVPQLLKMSTTSSSSKGKKKLDTLLSSFDLLSSHLGTSFTALSTALARSEIGSPSTAHFAILFGPTVSAASAAASTRARIILEIAGFDVRVWGTRDDEERRNEDDDDEDKEEAEGVPPDSDDEDDLSVNSEFDEESEEEVPSFPEPSDGESDDEDVTGAKEEPSIPSTYVPSELDIINAERLLSRTLAQANADASNGMAAEIPLTQVHILLRAPRRFAHPAWKPHQQSGVSRALDPMISHPNTLKSKPGKKRTDHHIRVQCQSSEEVETSVDTSRTTEESEEDEFIWWSWDAGKLEGSLDW